MGFTCGIVGLPNVGKSTLFNALTRTEQASAANYPFCTIEPNVANVPVADDRIGALALLSGSARQIHARIGFADIAGLVKGASCGEGLGNRFLAHVRETDAIVHVVRCFSDSGITHVEGSVDPLRDIGIIETELLLADLGSLEQRYSSLSRHAAAKDKDSMAQVALMKPILEALRSGLSARSVPIPKGSEDEVWQLNLLTSKPVIYVCNIGEGDLTGKQVLPDTQAVRAVEAHAKEQGAPVLAVTADVEAQIAALESDDERQSYLEALGLEHSSLELLTRTGYALLDLITYFTTGPKETRAWPIPAGTRAPAAAGRIHSDMERGFIAAEITPFEVLLHHGGTTAAKTAGVMRLEGRDYVVNDGDVAMFRFNV